MHWLTSLIFGLIALFWLTHGLRVLYGALRLPRLRDYPLAGDENCPRISILFAARDEEEKLAAALATLIALDYPRLEIVAVDDRSEDATPRILSEYAAKDSRVRVVQVNELPAHWLGKPHGLVKAYEASSGELLLFTDADVQFEPETLRRAVSFFHERKLDHLTLLCGLQMEGFWEKLLLTFFGVVFQLSTDPQRVANPKSRSYVGIGAFQLVTRHIYEAAGTHRKLALEVVDDLKLAKIVREAGGRSCVGMGEEHVTVRWHAGFVNIIRGVTKNFFAAAGYRVMLVLAHCAIIFLTCVLPFLSVAFLHGWARLFAAVAVGIAIVFQACVGTVMKAGALYGITQPIGAMVYLFMVFRSTAVTLWQGGVTWRGTFYSLKELRRGGAASGRGFGGLDVLGK
jgi:glycosyltransferase involved in cell wall biosynthesis